MPRSTFAQLLYDALAKISQVTVTEYRTGSVSVFAYGLTQENAYRRKTLIPKTIPSLRSVYVFWPRERQSARSYCLRVKGKGLT